MQNSILVKTANVAKKKRKQVNLPAQSDAILRFKESDEKDFIWLEWVMLNGIKLVFKVPFDKINALIKEESRASAVIR